MKPVTQPDPGFERRVPSSLWDTLMRVGLIGALVVLCFQVFSPFLHLMVWSIILAVTLYPLHRMLARRIGGRQGVASIILVILGIALIVVPTWLLIISFADSIQSLISGCNKTHCKYHLHERE